MKKLSLLFILCLLIAGCSPLRAHNQRMERLEKFHRATGEDTTLAPDEKNVLFIAELKKEFPEYPEEVAYLDELNKKIAFKREQAIDVTEDIAEFNKAARSLIDMARKIAILEEEAHIQGLEAMTDSLNRSNQQMNSRRLNCTTNIIGSTAYTNCY